jgi:hypothetical protein
MRQIEAEGLLFVGDPHISSRGPHRRTDDYTTAVLDKLAQACEIANERNLLFVCLGDLFDRPRDTAPGMLSALMRIFSSLKTKGVTLVGNHEKVSSTLTEDTALGVLAASGTIEVARRPGVIARVDTPARRIWLYGTPHGESLPPMIRPPGAAPDDRVVLITHHDLAISGASYPGSVEPQEIPGCDVVINGHDHTTKPWQQVGGTLYCNIGNITRVSVAQLDHVPAVYAMAGTEEILERVALEYRKDVFDLTGYNAQALSGKDLAANIQVESPEPSRFVQMLRDDSSASTKISDDGVEIRAEVDAVLAAREHESGKPLPAGLREVISQVFEMARVSGVSG